MKGRPVFKTFRALQFDTHERIGKQLHANISNNNPRHTARRGHTPKGRQRENHPSHSDAKKLNHPHSLPEIPTFGNLHECVAAKILQKETNGTKILTSKSTPNKNFVFLIVGCKKNPHEHVAAMIHSPLVPAQLRLHNPFMSLWRILLCGLALFLAATARADILWSDPGSRVIHATPDGTDIPGRQDQAR